MRNFDYYNPIQKMIFIAHLNWDDTVEVKAIRTPKKNTELRIFSYMAGGINQLYMNRMYKACNSFVIIFKFKKTKGITSARQACIFVSKAITNIKFE